MPNVNSVSNPCASIRARTMTGLVTSMSAPPRSTVRNGPGMVSVVISGASNRVQVCGDCLGAIAGAVRVDPLGQCGLAGRVEVAGDDGHGEGEVAEPVD